MAQYIARVGYGLTDALPVLAPFPIKANRIPTTADIGYVVGQIWIYSAGNAIYILSSIVSNSATWQLIEASGGAGVFTTLTSTGQFNLDTTAVGVNTLGNTTGATSLAISVGTGGFTLDGVASSTYLIGLSTTTGTIGIGGSAQTGTITVGFSTGTNILALGVGTGATTVNIATGITNAKTVNIGNGAAVANTIAIGGTGANVITVGDTQTAGSISLGAAMTTGTINIGSSLSGLVRMPFVSVTAAGNTVVNSVRVGQAIYTGLTTAAAATEVLTLTNALITATSSLFVTVSNLGSNDAQMTITRILPGAGTCAISLKNNGAAALNGNVQVSFWVN